MAFGFPRCSCADLACADLASAGRWQRDVAGAAPASTEAVPVADGYSEKEFRAATDSDSEAVAERDCFPVGHSAQAAALERYSAAQMTDAPVAPVAAPDDSAEVDLFPDDCSADSVPAGCSVARKVDDLCVPVAVPDDSAEVDSFPDDCWVRADSVPAGCSVAQKVDDLCAPVAVPDDSAEVDSSLDDCWVRADSAPAGCSAQVAESAAAALLADSLPAAHCGQEDCRTDLRAPESALPAVPEARVLPAAPRSLQPRRPSVAVVAEARAVPGAAPTPVVLRRTLEVSVVAQLLQPQPGLRSHGAVPPHGLLYWHVFPVRPVAPEAQPHGC